MKKIFIFLSIVASVLSLGIGIKTYARVPTVNELRINSFYSYIDSSYIARGPGDEWYDGYNGLRDKGILQENKLIINESISYDNSFIPNVTLYFDESYGFPLELFNVYSNAPVRIDVHYYFYIDNTWSDDYVTINVIDDYTYLQLYETIYNYSGEFDMCRIDELYLRSSESYTLTATDFSTITDSYNNGYNNGYETGYIDGESVGYETGYIDGESVGYNDGLTSNIEQNGFYNLINNIISFPINMLKTIFNFELFGINISGFILFLVSLGIVAFVIKLLSGGKNE